MKAVGVVDFGGPEALQLVDLPEPPDAEKGWVLIRVRSAAVNPADLAMRSVRGPAQPESPPYIFGMDAAGVIEQIGEGTDTKLKVGDEVMAIVIPQGSYGAYSEQIVVPVESVAPIPAGTTLAEAATLPMNGLTARLALDELALKPGDTLAVTGAAGTLGGYTIQLAKVDGLTVIADASEADEQLVRDLGADHVIRRGKDFGGQVREIVPDGADAVLDCALLDDLVVPAVRDGGAVATVRGFQGDAQRGIVFHPVYVPKYTRESEKLDRLRQQVDDGQLTLRVARTFPAEHAAEAHKMLEAGGVRGRLVLEF
ncbi:NADP-dependent oxidoreductase [Mycolicibacterium fortuitum]|uniref:Zn-dependent oxidoreductase n=1 Tax=Mycolicibacterium fortuitum subsp. fortuitum DSM 46621 = ATCC 6841 = JCM 6387 TaxID=1214102 RepID=K0UPN8_MYCFO|nr:NADP-dependent oxidoreductase [Mycolicibacterium fortuitum]AIY48000.1 putative quinone oxidoreductase [Mycobacterium sp. VKM Ac-1817D]CRL82806.1 zinc-binding alcohol dehydrogenase [Mycolicibacter nonchromogenicus]EJZ06950.1 Zn-dependent oxidoreductase [Mycolicibacterium fortuitum subsp. fortuitum DSM 46621 = ATCC 6841 = JCM 6387]WEV31605.1 NADP-dependent oxidoreductase [Mycolicibacterium fortuitum]CRL52776.1 zinc-binding alcohol dehydrogenase [Mycolicibacterium fortuitum subsp. fortuitum DS